MLQTAETPCLHEPYEVGDFFDEMFGPHRQPHLQCQALWDRMRELPLDDLQRRQWAAEKVMRGQGITFSVYGDDQGNERIFPFDIIPRIITSAEWKRIEK